MAFVNEFISEDDIKKYKLDELMAEFNEFSWRGGRPDGYIYAWTVDRQKNIYFLPVHTVEILGPSGRSQPTTKKICILNWEGKRIRLVIDLATGSSSKTKDSPFKIIWDLFEIDLSQASDVPAATVLKTLKEALTSYGLFGAYYQVPNTIVNFTF